MLKFQDAGTSGSAVNRGWCGERGAVQASFAQQSAQNSPVYSVLMLESSGLFYLHQNFVFYLILRWIFEF